MKQKKIIYKCYHHRINDEMWHLPGEIMAFDNPIKCIKRTANMAVSLFNIISSVQLISVHETVHFLVQRYSEKENFIFQLNFYTLKALLQYI